MHKQGATVIMTCTQCGSAVPVVTLIRIMRMPWESAVREHNFIPLLVHTMEGEHMVAHPAMPTDTMESV